MTAPRTLRIEAQRLAWEYHTPHAIIWNGSAFKIVRECQTHHRGWYVVDWYYPETR